MLACLRAFVLAGCASECACGLARAEQRQVLIPMMSRDTMRRVFVHVGERKRVGGGWLVLFELPAMLVTCLEIGGPMTFIFSETLSHYGTKLSYFFSWSASREASVTQIGSQTKNLWSASRVELGPGQRMSRR